MRVAAGGLLGLIGGRLLLLRGLVLCVPVYRVRGRGRSSGDYCRPADGAEQTRPTSSSHLALPGSSIREGRCGDRILHCLTRHLHGNAAFAADLPHGAGTPRTQLSSYTMIAEDAPGSMSRG